MKKLLFVLLSAQIYTLSFSMELLFNRTGAQALTSSELVPLLALIKLPTAETANNRPLSRTYCQRAIGLTPLTLTQRFKRSARQRRTTQTTSKL